jgi:hypothetical protein
MMEDPRTWNAPVLYPGIHFDLNCGGLAFIYSAQWAFSTSHLIRRSDAFPGSQRDPVQPPTLSHTEITGCAVR